MNQKFNLSFDSNFETQIILHVSLHVIIIYSMESGVTKIMNKKRRNFEGFYKSKSGNQSWLYTTLLNEKHSL